MKAMLAVFGWTLEVGQNGLIVKFPAGKTTVTIGVTKAAVSGDFQVNAWVGEENVLDKTVSIKAVQK
jgi:hypothetical protein